MRYTITCLVAGERRADQVEAPDAAAAVAAAREPHDQAGRSCELLSVLLLAEPVPCQEADGVEQVTAT
jgi:hypothetical protein